MNKVMLIGRLTKDPDYRQTQSGMAVARYTIAIDRIKDKEADFINCIAFGKGADFAYNYLHKGTKVALEGRIQTGSYTARDGHKVYTTDIIVERHEFCESRGTQADVQTPATPKVDSDGFLNVQMDDDLPFN